jgi:hypothetical protein
MQWSVTPVLTGAKKHLLNENELRRNAIEQEGMLLLIIPQILVQPIETTWPSGLRRLTRNQMGIARGSSNLSVVEIFFISRTTHIEKIKKMYP